MTAPNIKSPVNITGKTLVYDIDGTNHAAPTMLLENSDASGKVYRVNTIIVSSTGSLDTEVSVQVHDGSSSAYLVKELHIPKSTAQVIITKETYLYMEEDYEIRAARTTGGSNTASITISYEIIS